MAIDIENRRLLRNFRHPLVAKFGTPWKGLFLVGKNFYFHPQGPHFRSADDPSYFSPFPRRAIAQRFHRLEPGKRYEGQQQKNRFEAIKARRQSKVFVSMSQETARQKR